MKNRHISGMPLDKHREKVDAGKAPALRKQIIAYMEAKVLSEAAGLARSLALSGTTTAQALSCCCSMPAKPMSIRRTTS